MKKSNKQYAKILMESIEDLKGKDLDLVLKNFVEYLYNERKLKKANKIIEEFIRLYKKQEGIVELEVQTAREISDTLFNEIKKIFGKKIEIKTEINKNLLGGVVIKTEDKILDGSLRTQLKQLKNNLITL